jgi:hypothetical protein
MQVRGRRNDIPSHEDQVIKNIIACNNDLTLGEISNELYLRTNIKLSVLVRYPAGPKGSYPWVEKNIKTRKK